MISIIMKTQIPYLILSGLLSTTLVSQAALISFSTFDADGTQPSYQIDGVNQGSSSPAVTVVQSFGDPTTYSFTLVNDLDGGGSDDTLTFDFVYTIYTGSTISGGDVTLGSTQTIASPGNTHYGQGYTGDPDSNKIEAGDSFRLSIQNISYTDGEGDGNIAQFLGFERLTKFGGSLEGEDLLLGTSGFTTIDVGTATGSVVDFGGYVADDLVLTTNITSGTTNQRLRDLHFDFEVIPEPSTYALLGGLLALSSVMLRRRR